MFFHSSSPFRICCGAIFIIEDFYRFVKASEKPLTRSLEYAKIKTAEGIGIAEPESNSEKFACKPFPYSAPAWPEREYCIYVAYPCMGVSRHRRCKCCIVFLLQ